MKKITVRKRRTREYSKFFSYESSTYTDESLNRTSWQTTKEIEAFFLVLLFRLKKWKHKMINYFLIDNTLNLKTWKMFLLTAADLRHESFAQCNDINKFFFRPFEKFECFVYFLFTFCFTSQKKKIIRSKRVFCECFKSFRGQLQ